MIAAVGIEANLRLLEGYSQSTSRLAEGRDAGGRLLTFSSPRSIILRTSFGSSRYPSGIDRGADGGQSLSSSRSSTSLGNDEDCAR